MTYEPGKVYMHTTQYNKLFTLMRVRRGGFNFGSGRQDADGPPTWNGVPVVLDNTLPEGGWYIVPGAPQ